MALPVAINPYASARTNDGVQMHKPPWAGRTDNQPLTCILGNCRQSANVLWRLWLASVTYGAETRATTLCTPQAVQSVRNSSSALGRKKIRVGRGPPAP